MFADAMNTTTRKVLPIAALVVVIAAGSFVAIRAHEADRDAIEAVLKAQQEAWNSGDLDTFMASYVRSDSLRFVGGSGEILGWEATLARYQRTYPDRAAMGVLTFELKDIDLMGANHALVFGSYSLARESDNPTGLFTLALIKEHGEWLIFHDHTSADP